MGNKPVISKQQILDTAFAIASESGLSGLSIREVARACNVAVGTVYNSYPTKYDLVNDVVGRFWNEALADSMPGAIAGDDFIGFCEGLALQLSGALARFRDDWLTEVAALDAKGLASARKREEACFAHIRRGLVVALTRSERGARPPAGSAGPRTAVRVRVGQHALVHQTKRSPMRNPVHPPAPHAVRAPIRMR